MFGIHSVEAYKMRIALLESRTGRENKRVIAKLYRKIRALERA